MSILAHEGQHLADSKNYALARAIEIGIGAAVLNMGIQAGQLISDTAGALGAAAFREAWYLYQPAEKRARAAQKASFLSEHRNDIVFPRYDRV